MNYVPNHVPFVVVNVEPRVVLPEITGATLFIGENVGNGAISAQLQMAHPILGPKPDVSVYGT